jgi:hypothetical protein
MEWGHFSSLYSFILPVFPLCRNTTPAKNVVSVFKETAFFFLKTSYPPPPGILFLTFLHKLAYSAPVVRGRRGKWEKKKVEGVGLQLLD